MKIKHLLFLSIFSLILLNCSTYKKVETDLTRQNSKGKVKSIKTFSYEAIEKMGKITKGKRKFNSDNPDIYNTYEIFNDNGNLNIHYRINPNNSLTKSVIYKYDKKGNIIEENYYNSNGSSNGKRTFKYDKEGNIIEHIFYNSNGSIDVKSTFKYDSNGNIIKTLSFSYDSDGNLYEKETSKFTYNKNKIEESVYDSNNVLSSVNTYKYYNAKDFILGNWYRSYGGLLERKFYNDGKLEGILSYKYDDKGNRIEMKKFNANENLLDSKTTWKYDTEGNAIEQKIYDSDGGLFEKRNYKYENDNHGNWIKRVLFINETPKILMEREIEYYK